MDGCMRLWKHEILFLGLIVSVFVMMDCDMTFIDKQDYHDIIPPLALLHHEI